MSTSPTEITEFFQENGYYLAKGVYSPAEVAELERQHGFRINPDGSRTDLKAP